MPALLALPPFPTVPLDGLLPLVLVPICCGVAFWLRMVKLSGAIAGCLIAASVAHGMGWAGVAMLAALLGIGHFTTVSKRRKRGAIQVLCNGSVAAVACLVGGPYWGAVAMAGALATSLSDTAGGEMGQRYGGTPRFLLLGRRVPPGTDGGMSTVGTLAGLAIALAVPLAGWLFGAGFDTTTILLIAAGGFAGNLSDSVLGAVLQPYMGRRGNDWTNLLATLCGALVTVLLCQLMVPEPVYAAVR